MNPVALLSALPEPVLPESLQHEALSLLADTSADAAQERAEIAERAEPFTRSGFPVPLDPLASRRGPAGCVRAGCWVLVAVFVMFGGGAMLAANSLHHTSPPVSSALAPSVPSADAAPAVHTPKPSTSRSGHKKHGKHGAGSGSGTGLYTPGAGKSGKSSKPGSHPALPDTVEVQGTPRLRRAPVRRRPQVRRLRRRLTRHRLRPHRLPAATPTAFSGRSSAGCSRGRPEQAELARDHGDQAVAAI